MGGRALEKFGIKTERKSTKDFLRIANIIESKIQEDLNIETHVVKFYHEKETHGDLDLLVKIDHNFYNKNINLKKWVEETFKSNGIYVSNGPISFDYENFQVDIIPIKESNWNFRTWFDYDPSSNLVGKISHRFGCKYSWEGLKYNYRGDNGKVIKNIIISKDNDKILKWLGFDSDRYNLGFDKLEDIFEWVINSKYFSPELYDPENLSHIDRKRNQKRQTFQEFRNYISNISYEKTGYKFDRVKENYWNFIDESFPESNFLNEIKKCQEKERLINEIKEKFNGHIIMEIFPELQGKELGNVMTNFKDSFQNWNEYVMTHTKEEIIENFKLFYKN